MVLYNAAEWRDRRRPSPPEAEVPNTKQRKIPSKRPLQPSTTETPLFLWSSYKAENGLGFLNIICILDCRIGALGSKNEEKSNMQVAEQNPTRDSNFNFLRFLGATTWIGRETC